MVGGLLRRVRATLGEGGVRELLQRAGSERTPAYLDHVDNWIAYEESVALFEAAVRLTGDDAIAQRVGEETVSQYAGTPVATLLRGLGSPEAVFEQLTVAAGKFTTVTELMSTEAGPGRAVVQARMRPGYRRDRNMCRLVSGMLSQPPVLFGLPPARVEHRSCEDRGDERCVYEVTWDAAAAAAAAADPQQLIGALEHQLAAMTAQLDSVYATARDLIVLDSVDAALQRITERAVTAVRAPRYLLAVRTGDDRRLRVHHHGFGDEDVEGAARALLADDGVGDDSRLVAEIASATRRYGRIMAVSPAGAFFGHERDLLELYARYAAAVLDSHAALEAAQRRERQAAALLQLAQALAAATTSDEVAQRLADALAAVVDCDRAAVLVWEPDEQVLACRAVTGIAPGHERIRAMRIHRSEHPRLDEQVDHPRIEPLFHARDTDDPYVRERMAQSGAQAIVVLPIVAHDRLYGFVDVSVSERPERLAPTPGLRERLAGIAAQAATAFDNARLMETLAHAARHDNLTGLLGHRAFHEALEQAQAGPGARPFTLVAIDIDDFKRINDRHGHPVGDEALRRVAAALRRGVREHDTAFRVGGEEFAVLLEGLAGEHAVPVAERLRAAVAEAAFDVPLRVSLGLASWPDDAADGSALVERADAALYAAKRAGKDRLALASTTPLAPRERITTPAL